MVPALELRPGLVLALVLVLAQLVDSLVKVVLPPVVRETQLGVQGMQLELEFQKAWESAAAQAAPLQL